MLLMALGSADDHEQFIAQHLDEFDETFFTVVSTAIAQAEENGEIQFAEHLQTLGALALRQKMARDQPDTLAALDHMADLMHLCSATSLEEVQEAVVEKPGLASDDALDALRQMRQQGSEAHEEQVVARLSQVISWLEELRATPESPASLIDTLWKFIQARTWGETRAIVEAHPELLSETADQVLTRLIAEAESRQDQDALQGFTEHRDLLRESRALGPEAAFANKLVTPALRSLTQTILDFVMADTWGHSQQIIVAHPELLTEAADRVFAGMVEWTQQEYNAEIARIFADYRDLLTLCRTEGIGAGFVKHRASRLAKSDPSIQALVATHSPEQLRASFEAMELSAATQAQSASRDYYGLGEIYEQQGLLEQARECYMQALIDAEKTSDHDRQVLLLRKIADLSIARGEHRMGEQLLTRALQISEEHGDQKGIALVCARLGFISHVRGAYDKALEIYRRGILAAQAVDADSSLAEIYDYIGMVHRRQNDFEKAIKAHQQSIALYEKLGMLRDVAASNANLGSAYQGSGESNLAIKHYQNAASILERLQDKHGWAMAIDNIAATHSEQGNYPAALELHKQSLEAFLALGDEREAAIVYANIGTGYARMGDPRSAAAQLEKGLEITSRLGDKPRLAQMHTSLGEIYRQMGARAQAIEHYRKACELLALIGDRQMLQTVTLRLQMMGAFPGA
jgi:tetratricopeptide (TPR) repeat protein